MTVLKEENFKGHVSGEPVMLVKLSNNNGFTACFTNYGARIVGIAIPGKDGKLINVVSGYHDLQAYINSTNPFYGATTGIISIAGPDINFHGLHTSVWVIIESGFYFVKFSLTSDGINTGLAPDGFNITATYTLTDDNQIKIKYAVASVLAASVNITNHTCFNLNGEGNGNILRHRVRIKSDEYFPLNTDGVADGNIDAVSNTSLDFRRGTVIVSRIYDHSEQLALANGFDHHYLIRQPRLPKRAAQVAGDLSGIMLEVFTDQPVIHFYSGNHMPAANIMRSGQRDLPHSAFLMKTHQHTCTPKVPDAFMATIAPGQLFESNTVYKFSLV